MIDIDIDSVIDEIVDVDQIGFATLHGSAICSVLLESGYSVRAECIIVENEQAAMECAKRKALEKVDGLRLFVKMEIEHLKQAYKAAKFADEYAETLKTMDDSMRKKIAKRMLSMKDV